MAYFDIQEWSICNKPELLSNLQSPSKSEMPNNTFQPSICSIFTYIASNTELIVGKGTKENTHKEIPSEVLLEFASN